MTRRARGEGRRQGFTTGSAAAAAAKAAINFLMTGRSLGRVDIPLPPGARPEGSSGDAGRLDIPVAGVGAEGASARASVVKDAGDDPDATHGARISCVATLEPGSALPPVVAIDGGRGVGRVTLPGLPVPVGRAAINPAPLAQIGLAAREALPPGWSGTVRLIIEVEDGEALARHTFNPRLGVVGGISILGTQGVVKPYSLDAWRATIDSGLTVASAAGMATVAFSTGRRSERLLMARRPELPELAFVQAADFFAWSLRRAVELRFAEIVWGCFFGKLAKMAQGLEYTHAHAGETDFGLLAELAGQAGAGPDICHGVAGANTARHALEIVPGGAVRSRFAGLVLEKALGAARAFAGPGPRLGIVCFGFDERVLCEAYIS